MDNTGGSMKAAIKEQWELLKSEWPYLLFIIAVTDAVIYYMFTH